MSPVPDFPKPVTLIANPVAGPGRKRRRSANFLNAAKNSISGLSVVLTRGPGDASGLAKKAVQDGAKTVIVCGGDGTINEAVQGLAHSPACLVPLPAGTANVLCRELRLPPQPMEALEHMTGTGWKATPVTLGQVKSARKSRYFLLMAGAGLDAEVVARVPPGPKKRLGIGAYMLYGMLTGFTWGYPRIRVTVDGAAYSCTSAVIANAKNYAASVVLAPDARLTREDLCMVLFDGPGPGSYLAFGMAMLAGRHTRMSGVTTLSGSRFTLAAEGPVRCQLDGELHDPLPVTVTAQPGALRLWLPNAP